MIECSDQNTAALRVIEVCRGNQKCGVVGSIGAFFDAPPIKALNADKRSARPLRATRNVAG
jgi:hypothetical protein